MNTAITGILVSLAGCLQLLAADAARATTGHATAVATTAMARQLVLERIDSINQDNACRQDFLREGIDFDRLRKTAESTRFYSAAGDEGGLKFSEVIGRPADPDQTLRVLAAALPADAFVLGFQQGSRYIRTHRVVLTRGYFEQDARPTTLEEKQSLLLHEVLHIALDKNDDDLNSRALCPLRLLAFCQGNTGTSQR